MRNEIVVGLDGSAASRDALVWATAAAERWRGTVVAVHAWIPVTLAAGAGGGALPMMIEHPDHARTVIAEQVALVRTRVAESVAIDERIVAESPTIALLAQARDARMLVVGTGRKGRFGRLVLGTTSEACAHDATCPVVVVPGLPDRPIVRTIVVGVDDSPNSHQALAWAVEEAARDGALVEAFAVVPPTGGDVTMALADVRERLDHVARPFRHPARVELLTQAVLGDPAGMLCTLAHDADLLVVGRRGRGHVAGLLLGSVADDCVRHAPCPVAVIPA
ncbi:MAG TPA: universal stress protein [Acidimicrobiales bacterium]|nr:universal stress protein [Acidimicrobiales bacterium]